MDELYGNETTTSQDELEVRYDKELSEAERKQASAPDKDPDRKHFRHFDEASRGRSVNAPYR